MRQPLPEPDDMKEVLALCIKTRQVHLALLLRDIGQFKKLDPVKTSQEIKKIVAAINKYLNDRMIKHNVIFAYDDNIKYDVSVFALRYNIVCNDPEILQKIEKDITNIKNKICTSYLNNRISLLVNKLPKD